MTVVSAAVAEAAAQLITGVDIQLRPHNGDPGATHDANPSPGIGNVTVDSTGWAAFVDDTPTLARGGRVTTNTAEAEFSASATDTGQIAYLTYWQEADPVGAAGTFDVWVKTVQLTTAVDYSTGNRVYIPIGDLEVFGAGSE